MSGQSGHQSGVVKRPWISFGAAIAKCSENPQLVQPRKASPINGPRRSELRNERPALDAMLKAVARREMDMVAAWSVDRLGRSLMDLLVLLRELHAKGVDLFLHQQGLDTSSPSGRAMFQMMGVFAEFERAMIRERVLAGLARAKEQGTRLGRRRIEDADSAKAAAVRAALASGKGIRRIARDLKVGVGTVLRLKAA
jgi:DNA invertase Pin-like site-specific DNA recombinase